MHTVTNFFIGKSSSYSLPIFVTSITRTFSLVSYFQSCCYVLSTTTITTIANLAMADVIIGMFSIPFQFQAAVKQRWDLPRFMCPFCPFVQILSVNVSIFTLTAIAIDRHKAILNPLRARSSKQASKIIIAIIWLTASLLAAPISYGLRVVDLEHYIFSEFFFSFLSYSSCMCACAAAIVSHEFRVCFFVFCWMHACDLLN
jgi:leucokinin receptor